MRQIAEESLRTRLKSVELTVGEVVELKGVGEVVIMELNGTRAKVRYLGFSTWSWVEVSQLKRP